MTRPSRVRRPEAKAERGTLRVVSGSVGGRRFDAPGGTTTRPTSERAREATFNALESLGVVVGARVLDAFAGSGALGIEALSRGAAHVTFAETDRAARTVIEANLTALGLQERSTVVGGDGLGIAERQGPWDLVLLDPPYAFDGWAEALAAVGRGLADEGLAVIESGAEVAVPASLHPIRCKAYGGTVVTFAAPSGAPK